MVLVAVVIGLIFWVITPLINSSSVVFSPLPDFLTLLKNNQVSTITLFKPRLDADGLESAPLSIHAKSAIAYDLTEDKIVYTKNPTQKLPMASLTKIMTAIIALENKLGSDQYVVKGKALVGEDSMGLTPDESLSLEELLYGLMLVSGNDAAEVIADNYPAGRDNFVVAMNNKALALGLSNTHFTNPTGLEGDGDQYTSVYDLLVITKYAIVNFPMFDKVAKTVDYHIPYSSAHKEFYLYNETNLLTTYPGVKGIKTGFTPEAGLCLATYLDYQNHKIIAILLGSDDRRNDMKKILDFSLQSAGIKPPKVL